MQQCNCNQCGTSIEVADGINFVTCRNCQTSLKIHRTEYVVYTEVVENKQNDSKLNNYLDVQNLPQDTAKQEREQAQAELHLTYRKLDALNDEWRTKYPRVSANSTLMKQQNMGVAAISILAGVACLLAIFVKPDKMEVSALILFGAVFLIIGVASLIYANSGSGLIGESQAHERKKAEIKKKIAELEQKIQ